MVTCQHCHQCAFCEPRYNICWMATHYPRKKWEALLDIQMGNGDVLNTLKEKGIGMRQNKRRLRSAYCQYYCDPVPQADPVPSEVPKPKRQCTVLPMGAYMETTSTNFFSPEEKIRLKKFNHLWSFDHRQKLHEPITMDQAQHANNSHLLTHMHWYCQQALDIYLREMERSCTIIS